jgi:hypothetical protein
MAVKFSDCVNDLVLVWLDWLKNDKISRDLNAPINLRAASGKKCEALIKKRYELIGFIDSFFEE